MIYQLLTNKIFKILFLNLIILFFNEKILKLLRNVEKKLLIFKNVFNIFNINVKRLILRFFFFFFLLNQQILRCLYI